MANDMVAVAIGASCKAAHWENKNISFAALARRCSTPLITNETMEEYAAMSKDERLRVKDVGGFVGGVLLNGKRNNRSVLSRSIVTLDADEATGDVWERFCGAFEGVDAYLYSTHSHTPEKPRVRLVVRTARPMMPSEYEATARHIAEAVGVEMFDRTTYEPARMMFWPSCCFDADFVYRRQEGAGMAVVEDCGYNDNYGNNGSNGNNVVQEPTAKPGVIGAFCRAYTIDDAIGMYLGGIYTPCDHAPGRYTYAGGTTTGGLVTYDGKYAYSHHQSDPAGGRILNAWDIVRLHRCGGGEAESQRQMGELALKDARVKDEMRRTLAADFEGMECEGNGNNGSDGNNGSNGTDAAKADDWRDQLEYSKGGGIKPTLSNCVLIIEHDEGLAGRLWHDDFSGYDVVVGGLPWREDAVSWKDDDSANLRVYIEKRYGVEGKGRIEDALTAVMTAHHRHPVKAYLEGLTWDGEERLDRLVIDYLGAEDNALTRAMTRKHFTAAVARIYEPGVKYDYCLILVGPEGCGKSTLFATMGGEWYNDSLTTMDGKEAMEQLSGGWVFELPEITALKRSEVESIKSFLSRQCDAYRRAYGQRVVRYPRQCVFGGTTNEEYFLTSKTGDRRFWVVAVNPELRTHRYFRRDLRRDRDQIWAEAVYRYRQGEELMLDDELSLQAKTRQEAYNDEADDPIKASFMEWLDEPVPRTWETWGADQRRSWYTEDGPLRAIGSVVRQRVAPREFLWEKLGMSVNDPNYKWRARDVSRWLRDLGWTEASTSRHAEKAYGRQKAFERPDEKTGEK